jgi:uncharacterized RDD family membrane protein YckC
VTTADVLDTLVSVETPEGIVLELRPAGLTARAYAFALDLLVRLVILYIAVAVHTFMGGIGVAFTLVLMFGLEWLYPVVFELTLHGATPGKRVVGLRVVMDNGLPITPAASFTRNLLRAADFLPFMWGFAIISMLLRRDFKRLGDIAAATLVVYQPAVATRPVFEQIAPLAPAFPLASRDQAAVIALAARAPRLTAARLDELAGLAAKVSGDEGQTGPEVTRRVLAVAHWLLGKR